MGVAASEDYGRDVEHIELLIQKFESFLTSLATNDHKVAGIRTEAEKLLEDKHPDPDRIRSKVCCRAGIRTGYEARCVVG